VTQEFKTLNFLVQSQ